MPRQIPWVWLSLLALLLLAPSPAGRLILDVVGGITLTLLLLPLLLGAAGFLAWQVLRRRLRVCPACGLTSLGVEVCPACGTGLGDAPRPFQDGLVSGRQPASPTGAGTGLDSSPADAGTATIDVEVLSSQACDEEER